MTIIKLIRGEKVNVLHINVIEKISKSKYIVGDQTGMAVMTVDEETHQKQVEVGKGVRIMKPKKIDQNVIATNAKIIPSKTKPLLMTVDDKRRKELKGLAGKMSTVDPGTAFNDIKENFGENAVVGQILAYVTSVSKVIEGKYGNYQIVNLRDCIGSKVSINLYTKYVNAVEVNKVYRIEKIKKTAINDDSGLRLATTNYTKIDDASTEETDLFKNTKIADKSIEGTCVMFNEYQYYKSCATHSSKLDDKSHCTRCGELKETSTKQDFRCTLFIEENEKQGKKGDKDEITTDEEQDDEEVAAIKIFRRHVDIEILDTDDENTVQEKLENHVYMKVMKVQYNEIGPDNYIAVKVTIVQ